MVKVKAIVLLPVCVGGSPYPSKREASQGLKGQDDFAGSTYKLKSEVEGHAVSLPVLTHPLQPVPTNPVEFFRSV
jgi:hypothetical protein